MTLTQLYLLLAAATATAGLLCIGGVVLAERLGRHISRRVLTLFAAAFLALLPLPFASIWPISLVVLLGMALTFPVRGHMVPLIGVGDLVVMSALIGATRRLGYPTMEVAVALGMALLMALGVGLLAGGIYLLPFLAATLGSYLVIRRRLLRPSGLRRAIC